MKPIVLKPFGSSRSPAGKAVKKRAPSSKTKPKQANRKQGAKKVAKKNAARKPASKAKKGKKPQPKRSGLRGKSASRAKSMARALSKAAVTPEVKSRVVIPEEMSSQEIAHVAAAILAHRHLTPMQRSLMERFYNLLHDEERHAQQRISHYAHQVSRVQEALPAFRAIADHGDVMEEEASEEISDLNSDY